MLLYLLKLKMVKSLLLSLSLVFFAIPGIAQNTEMKQGKCDCFSKTVRDSLIVKYLDSGAHKYWYTTPQWQIYCDSLIAICPNIAVAYQNKAIPFIKYGDYEKAFALEDKAVELEPRNYTAYRGFLKCIFTKDYEGSIIDFEKAQQLLPNSYEMDHTYFFYEGLCNLELGNYSKAEENLKKDIFIQTGGDTLKSAHFNSLYYLGVIYFEMKNYELANNNLLKCIKVYKEHPQANYYMAQIYKAKGNTELEYQYLLIAKKALEKGYEINEDNLYYSNYPHQVRLYEVELALANKK
jgi:tetratricopeptide (TPR) repeat protein